MVERGCRGGLAAEPFSRLWRRLCVAVQALDRDVPVQTGVEGEQHVAHPTLAQASENPVDADLRLGKIEVERPGRFRRARDLDSVGARLRAEGSRRPSLSFGSAMDRS